MKQELLIAKALKINEVASHYFQQHPGTTQLKPKDLMTDLVESKIFPKDHKEGLPLRNILRELDENNLLHLIPLLRVERKDKNRLWYFTTARH